MEVQLTQPQGAESSGSKQVSPYYYVFFRSTTTSELTEPRKWDICVLRFLSLIFGGAGVARLGRTTTKNCRGGYMVQKRFKKFRTRFSQQFQRVTRFKKVQNGVHVTIRGSKCDLDIFEKTSTLASVALLLHSDASAAGVLLHRQTK